MIKDRAFKIVDGADKEVELKSISISPDIRLESSKWYARAFDAALDNGCKLRLEVEKMLESRGLLDTKVEQAKATALKSDLRKKEVQLKSAKVDGKKINVDEGFKLAMEMQRLRRELQTIGSNTIDYFKDTVEAKADEERFQFFIYACTIVGETGERFWPSFEAYKNDKEAKYYGDIVTNFVKISLGMDTDLENVLYENKWLKKMGFVDSKGRFINKQGHLIDSDGKLINEKGQWVDAQNNVVDQFGNLIDIDGNLMVPDGWDLPVVESNQLTSTISTGGESEVMTNPLYTPPTHTTQIITPPTDSAP